MAKIDTYKAKALVDLEKHRSDSKVKKTKKKAKKKSKKSKSCH